MKHKVRQHLLLTLVGFFCLLSVADAGSTPAVVALDSIGLTVSDIDRSVDFFSKVLSFEKVSDKEIFGSSRRARWFGM